MLTSKRLSAIADYVLEGSRLADIGSDHALLPVELVGRGTCPSAIAGEVNDGPLEAARRGIAAAGLASSIEARKGDGLEVLQPGEADTVTIAGMGGALIVSILEAGRLGGKLDGVRQLVLQPNVGEELVRAWLLEHGWHLAEESILEEDGKIYEVLHALSSAEARERSEELYGGEPLLPGLTSEEDRRLKLRMGPYLTRRPSEAFARKWSSELRKLRGIALQLERSDTEEAAARKRELAQVIDRIEEVLACTRTDMSSLS
ncbi:tRNA (adenine(22)-N(1))-methyltransferase [Paenibacillus pasadenensis]|uniref:Putative tRNA-m1A22 methylase n=1 Tax=Paenibacillus pasadenensis TaxID=217090 RepID=A0A2N5N858_9BACL|nr:class I SAM-dependent methyltransferase [Paenibacillus pasadenensis]PLT46522.1 putative tRNA-m1A22 methylase [Paenibacillus pasadenensis]